MLYEGVKLTAIRSTMSRLSPAIGAMPGSDRAAYIDGQVDVLDHVLRRMTQDQREQAGPKPVSAVRLRRMSALHQATYDEWPDHGFEWVTGQLPGMPPSITDVAVITGGATTIDGFVVHLAEPRVAPPAGSAQDKTTSTPESEPLFDSAGQPSPHARAILDGIRKHRAAFRLDQGRLTAPGQPAEHQKLLADMLADPRFADLAVAAYRGAAGVAGAAMGDTTQR